MNLARAIVHTVATVFFVLVAVVPVVTAASGLTSSQTQAILSLLQSFGADTATIASVQLALTGSGSGISSNTITSSVPTGTNSSCTTLSQYLSLGSKDAATLGEVSRLQQFLGISPTGYFGLQTKTALQSWQSAHGVVSSGSPGTTGYGAVGSKTRSAMSCGNQPVSPTVTPIVPPPTSVGPANNMVTPTASPGSAKWSPSWLSSTDLKNPPAWNPVNPYGCNAISFGSDPALGNLLIGRILNNTSASDPCSGNTWSLVWASMNWSTNTITPGEKFLDTSSGPVTLGDGNAITSAYDASVAVWADEVWVAFECYGYGNFAYPAASSCVGPLKKDLSLDLSRTVVAVGGISTNANDTYGYSASVPKLLSYQGRLYLYWSTVRYPKSTPISWTDIVSRGAELAKDDSNRVWTQTGNGSAIASNESSSVEVFGLNPNDMMSNRVADLSQVITDGTALYFTAARGGGDCVSPGGTPVGCYRLTIGRSTSPLGAALFNQQLLPEGSLPLNPEEYYRFVYRPTDGRTVLLGGTFLNPHNDPALNAGMKLLVWPDSILKSAVLPVGYASTPAPFKIPTTPCGTLSAGSVLTPGKSINSCNGQYQLMFQGDGNLVLYKGSGNSLWATNTTGKSGAKLTMQTDGNLVLYDAGGAVLWASSVSGGQTGAAAKLALQDDGNLVLYATDQRVLWASNTATAELAQPQCGKILEYGTLIPSQPFTSCNGAYVLLLQQDGNLVVYKGSAVASNARWATNTQSNTPARLTVNWDGDLILWSTGNTKLWESVAHGGRLGTPKYLWMQDDGNLVLYAADNSVLWALSISS